MLIRTSQVEIDRLLKYEKYIIMKELRELPVVGDVCILDNNTNRITTIDAWVQARSVTERT